MEPSNRAGLEAGLTTTDNMPLTPDQLDNWTTHHPPTEETAPKYAAIRAAEARLHDAIFGEVWRLREVHGHEHEARSLYDTWKDQPGWVPWVEGGNSVRQTDARRAVGGYHSPPELTPNTGVVNLAAREFMVAIDTHAPDSADKTAAIRCVRLARNAANEALYAVPREKSTPIYAWVTVDTMKAEAHRQIVLARFQACSAIACGGK